MIKTAKFGGSSVSDAEQFKKVKGIIESDKTRQIVVISAAGKRSGDDHKLTDLLYLCHAHLTYGVPCDDILDLIQERFREIKTELGLAYDIESEFAEFRAGLSKDTSSDEIVSRGEYFTSKLMAEYLGFNFLDAKDCILFGFDGTLDREKTYEAIKKAYDAYGCLVIPGFYGSLPNGKIKVMTRGGSDITGALAAAATGCSVYENWTDVSGILMADPRIVDNPRPISRVTYAELRELAFMGASVLHEDSVMPVKEKGIALNIRNTNAPEDPGTVISDTVDDSNDEPSGRFITGIAGRRNFDILTVTKRNMELNPSLRRVLEIFERFHVPVEHISLGLDTFSIVASHASLGEMLYDIIGEIRKQVDPDDVNIRDNIALVAAVGRKMASKPGVSGRIFKALGENRINCRTIAQAADELSIIVGIDNSQLETAIRVLYDGFAG